MIKIAPSILASNVLDLGNEIKALKKAKADYIHFDVMDGYFVPNMTFGPQILEQAKKQIDILYDVHLMVEKPSIFIPWYAKAGADIITFHIETKENIIENILLIKSFNKKVGLSIKPDTQLDEIIPYIDMIDLILVMSVNPGFGGQKFNEIAIDKIKRAKNLLGNRNVVVEVDGGINNDTAKLCIDAGVDILVAGTAIFNNGNYNENIKKLKGE